MTTVTHEKLKVTKIALHRTRLRFSDYKNFSVGTFYKQDLGKLAKPGKPVRYGRERSSEAESEVASFTPETPAHEMTYCSQVQLQAASSNAISDSFRQVSQRKYVRIDNIEIKTQATNTKDIGQEIPGNLKDATWHFDDG
ncbi:hypothetical protein HZD82_10230 [Pantoea agglomerans]|nr:hypothetical protein [Pantoea agglomerans]